ncbi:glycosyltransferase [Patescibacteria group bacterium]|nr:glycosyltransferase [Patescibacteria group bacterium]
MGVETLTYPFLFIAIFFESFLLVTFLSKPARASRAKSIAPTAPNVAVIVPVWNEETTLAGTIDSLLALDYPAEKLSIILVNDGSTDATPAVIDRFAHHPQITALHKENGGKFSAMNLGVEHARGAELIGFLDADSFVAPDSLREIVAAFDASRVAAVTASMAVHEPQTFMQRMQYAEYTLAITLRHVLASLNGLYVTPGPFSFYRRSVLAELGPFKHAHLAEDMEMAMRLQRAGYAIGNAIRARVYTKSPPTLPKLVKQRVRWTTGFLRNILFDYRDLIGIRKNAVLGMFVLPLALITIGGGIFIFMFSMTQILFEGLHTLSIVQAAPLSYAFVWRPFSWYDVPATAPELLGVALLVVTLGWMVVGKRLSRIPGKLAPNLLAYLAFYWIVAPLWLIRSVSDVARGARTTWR